MQPIAILIEENAGITRVGEPIRIGIPFPKGCITKSSEMCLVHNSDTIPCQVSPLSTWPDGSIRWLLTCFQTSLIANGSQTLYLTHKGEQLKTYNNIEVINTEDFLLIQTSGHNFQVSKKELSWEVISSVNTDNTIPSRVRLIDINGFACTAGLESSWEVSEVGPVCVSLQSHGSWIDVNKNTLAQFNCVLRFYPDSPTIIVEIRIHNPKRAIHSGGLWDLGDPGSIYFKSLTIESCIAKNGEINLEAEPNTSLINVPREKSFSIYQDSSGGVNWNSANHINANEELTVTFSGYQVHAASEVVKSGKRALPILRWRNDEDAIQIGLKHFWQNFPSALRADRNTLFIDLFPGNTRFPYELQGGESKTHTCVINYSSDENEINWIREPLIPTIASSQYDSAKAFPWFNSNAKTGLLDKLISKSLEGPGNFFAKREVIDEYGWRNFGDIFADHETLYQNKGEKPFISHYNNQYDAVYGFCRQFCRTGDPRWFELMDDLARHICDIDIYQTNEDRAEYNNGLFWHTDHYLDAHTSTHRTFSRLNKTSSTPGQTGGGPAAEHCYTSGLLYHYWLTGNVASKEALLNLANWMIAYYEGTGGLLEQVFALIKHDIPMLKALLRGESPTTHRYPFTRGTGNYLNALLDAWQLTKERDWLERTEHVIKATIHPDDDLVARNLLNAEKSWSYLVLLSSITKYLTIKVELGEFDDNYQYALSSLIHYTRWMSSHEYPFLTNAVHQEFPNDTWAAQDIRKAILMFQASIFDPACKKIYLGKANEWLTYVTSTLLSSPESHFARIQCILLLNYGAHQIDIESSELTIPVTDWHPPDSQKLKLTWRALLTRMVKRFVRGIISFRPAREYAWLHTRLAK